MVFFHQLAGAVALASAASAAPSIAYEVDPSFPLAYVATLSEAASADTTVTWTRTDGKSAPTSYTIKAGATRATLLRWTPKTAYSVVATGGAAGEQSITVGATGIQDFDLSTPLVETVSGTPTFELLAFDGTGSRAGLAAVDREGWLVWYSQSDASAWDVVPHGGGGGNGNVTIASLATPGAHVEVNSGMQERSMTNALLANVTDAALSHEAHVDTVDPALPVLTLGADERAFANLTAPQKGNKLVRWDRAAGTTAPLAALFDYFDPVRDHGACSTSAQACGPASAVPGGGDSAAALAAALPALPADDDEASTPADWAHANAACRGYEGNYLMSARHLSAVVSWKSGAVAAGSVRELDFVMSGEGVRASLAPASTLYFGYDQESSRHYNQHCVRQLPNGNVMMFDNGDTRPAAQLDAKGRFSRLAEYKLDRAAGVATLVYEFRPMLNATHYQYSFHAGSIARLTNGNTVGGFSCDSTAAHHDASGKLDCSHMAYEADKDGKELARMRVPLPLVQPTSGPRGGAAGYRALPLTTLAGERRVPT